MINNSVNNRYIKENRRINFKKVKVELRVNYLYIINSMINIVCPGCLVPRIFFEGETNNFFLNK